MKVAVIGSGGVGGLVGGLLARAGIDVAFLARGRTLQALQQQGLHVASPLGDFSIRPVVASSDPAVLGGSDVVLVTVKAWQVMGIPPTLLPLLNHATPVIPVQNEAEAAVPKAAHRLAKARKEAERISKRLGIRLRPDASEISIAGAEALPAGSTTSMHRDIVEGRASELEEQTGAVVRFAHETRSAAPVHAWLRSALLPQELQTRKAEPRAAAKATR